MRINAVNSNYRARNINTQRNFCGLIKDRSALPIIDSMSKSDISEFKKIEKRLSKTKFWDMKISSAGNKFKDFTYQFIDKTNKRGVITGGIYPYDKKDNMIKIYTIVYGPENIYTNAVETLRFQSKKRAAELYEKYVQNAQYAINRGYNLTPIETLKNKEIELKMLEESSQIAEANHKISQIHTETQTKSVVGNELLK